MNALVHAYWSQTTDDRWWKNAVCEIAATQEGRMFCAMECDGHNCDAHATAERLEAAKAYTAALRQHNRRCTREERRYRSRRTEEAVNMGRRRVG